MDNYTFGVVSLRYGLLDIYPVSVKDELAGNVLDVDNEEELRGKLKSIFTSDAVRRVMAALLRESTA